MTDKELRRKAKYPDTDTFMYHNENPKGLYTADCLYRAIADATGMCWYDVHTAITALEKKEARTDELLVKQYLKRIGWTRQKQPRTADNTKYTAKEWCKWLSKNYPNGDIGNILAHVGSRHIVCIRPIRNEETGTCQYKVCDTWDCTEYCVGIWWISTKQNYGGSRYDKP